LIRLFIEMEDSIDKIKDDGNSVVVPLELAGCMIHVKHRLPNPDEIELPKQYCVFQGDTPWNSSSFSDQSADKSYQQAIDNIQRDNLNTRFDLRYFDPSDACSKASMDFHVLHVILGMPSSMERLRNGH
jgi:hypothetical protein